MTKKENEKELTGLELLRKPFDVNHISKLPKPTKKQTEAVRNDFKAGIRCGVCGGWHHPQVIHLDYVGHAAITDRLLNADPHWSWEPVAFNQNTGLPQTDENGGLWIRLTVCGTTRLGYGHPDGKTGGDALKEAIGDALRNAGMRFGMALDLWHKGDLHPTSDDAEPVANVQSGALTEEEKIKARDLVNRLKSFSESGSEKMLDALLAESKSKDIMQAMEKHKKTYGAFIEKVSEARAACLARDAEDTFPGDM